MIKWEDPAPRNQGHTNPHGKHIMIDFDVESMTGLCTHCGPIGIVKQRNSWVCRTARYDRPGAHGLTVIEARDLREGKTCAICDAPAEHVDHCHTTGKLREPLCARHNLGIGYFKDNPEEMRRAAEYIERHTA